MSVLHRALIGVFSQSDPQMAALKRVIKSLYRLSDVHGVSPVYEYKSPIESGMCLAISLRTQSSPDELSSKILKLESQIKINKAEVFLLVYDDYLIREPDLTIPWIELHSSKKWAGPASYLWPDYIHPVEQKDLKSIFESLGTEETLEFYNQSNSVLDFLSFGP